MSSWAGEPRLVFRSVRTPAAVRGALVGLGGQVDRDAERRRELEAALTAMVYVHPCHCGDGIPNGQCARCRSVTLLGFDPAVLAGEGGR